ncbi:MAG: sodium:calcium antiporter, partial [Prevotella sp.]|nr:sodium:calcium antiporter [Prevotella sp.]
MLLDCVFMVVGVVLVLWGADRLTEGAASMARRFNVPEIVIGLTIVAAGTSAPELFVSVTSALQDTPDLAVGNVLGSNIINTLLIVGVAAMVAPMSISRSTVRKDIPFSVLASVLLIVLCLDTFDGIDLQG